jgi:hypothetical protein
MSANLLAEFEDFYQHERGNVAKAVPIERQKEDDKNSAILFDADAEGEFDDFGDFESATATIDQETCVSPHASAVSQSQHIVTSSTDLDLLSLIAETNLKASTLNTHRPVATSNKEQDVPQKEHLQEPEEAWDDWTTAEVSSKPPASLEIGVASRQDSSGHQQRDLLNRIKPIPTSSQNQLQSSSVTPALSMNFMETQGIQSQAEITNLASEREVVAPTNVPPPSRLLSLFPVLLQLSDLVKLQNISSLNATQRSRLEEYMNGYLLLVQTAGRILAGRGLRWKRDKYLSASNTISSSKARGMKLQTLDKTERLREDIEAMEVKKIWASYAGRARSVAAMLFNEPNESKPGLFHIPDLNGQLKVKIVDIASGGIADRNPCALCGLNRDERVSGLDNDMVLDSFGEWWTVHWGHRACQNWWIKHEAELRSSI